MCIFSEYKDIFGVIGKGVHKYRFLNTGAVDYFGTLLGGFILTYITNLPLVISTIGLYLLGLILHLIFGVETGATKFLGMKC